MGAVLTESAIRALGVFGLTTRDVGRCDRARHEASLAGAGAIYDALGESAGRIALILGPSGSGKSTLLRALRRLLEDRAEHVVDTGVLLARALGDAGERRVIDVLGGWAEMNDALAALSTAGLADAFVPARRVRELSDGQRARLAIALGMCVAPRKGGGATTVLLDELGGALDDGTTRGVCATLGRWVRSAPNVRLVAVGTREGVLEWLGPEVLARVRDDGQVHTKALPQENAGVGVRIDPGTIADYDALAHLHYRAGRPATAARVLVARSETQAVGVLVASMPTLNGAWRRLAWPDEYSGARVCKRDAARQLNRDVRCISRVVVDPRWRGRGVGASLVRAYLADALTSRTEVVSAMGAVCPMFTRAGMREWPLERSPRDVRLVDAIEAAGLRAWMIADIDLAIAMAIRHPFLVKALRIWARAHGPTRPLAAGPLEDIVQAAARSVVHKPRAYTHG